MPEFPIMIISNESEESHAGTTAFDALAAALTPLDIDVVRVPSAHHATIISMASRVSAVVVSVAAPDQTVDIAATVAKATRLVHAIRARNEQLPIFLFGERLTARVIPSDVLQHVHGCINAYEDTGLLHELVTAWSGSECDLLVHDGLVLDRRQTPQASLPATPVIGPLDPNHDHESQLFPCGPGAAVEDVLLQQAEERFHRRVIASSTNPTMPCWSRARRSLEPTPISWTR